MINQTPWSSQEIQSAMAEGRMSAQQLQQFQQPLSSNVQWGGGGIDPAVNQQVAQGLDSLASHPMFNGQGVASRRSGIFNQTGADVYRDDPYSQYQHGWEGMSRIVWDSTVGAWWEDARKDPGKAIAMGALTVGMFALAGAADTATLGLATPLLWTGFALFALPQVVPNTVHSVAEAIQRPDDLTVTAAVVNVGTAAFSVLPAGKAWTGVKANRAQIAREARRVTFEHRPGEVVNTVIRRGRKGPIEPFLQPGEKFGVVPQSEMELDQEVQRRALAGEDPMDPVLLENYRNQLREGDAHMGRLRDIQSDIGQASIEGRVPPESLPRYAGHKPIDPNMSPEEIAQELNQRELYHGSGIRGLGRDDLSITKADPHSLFGPGLYVTDHPGVAHTYARERGRGQSESVYKAKTKFTKVHNADAPMAAEVSQAVRKVAEERGVRLDAFDWDKASLSDLEAALEKSGQKTPELMDDIQEALYDQGHDAIVYSGGVRTGGEEHTAVHVMDPGGQLGREPSVSSFVPHTHDEYLENLRSKLPGVRSKLDEAQKEMIPIQKEIAHRYGFRLARENPIGRVSKEDVAAIPAAARSKADRLFRPLHGILHFVGEGYGWDEAPDDVVHSQFAANLAEAMARGDQAGGIKGAEKVMDTQSREAAKALGISEGRIETIDRAIEGHRDPERDQAMWGALSPAERYYAEKRHIMFGIMTNYAYKHGHVALPLGRYVPRIVTHDDPEAGRGVRAHHKFQEGLAGSTKGVGSRSWVLDPANRSLMSAHDDAIELQEAEFDEADGMASLADRLHQGVSREDFEAGEQQAGAAYKILQPLAAAFRDSTPRELGGKQTSANQFLHDMRRQHGNFVRNRNQAANSLEQFDSRMSAIQLRGKQAAEQVRALEETLSKLRGVWGQGGARSDAYKQLVLARREQRKAITAADNLNKQRPAWESSLKKYSDLVDQSPAKWAKELGVDGIEGSEDYFNTERKSREDIQSLGHTRPGGRRLVKGHDLTRVALSRFLRQMNYSRYERAWNSITHMPSNLVKGAYGLHSDFDIAEVHQMDQANKPIALPGNLNLGDRMLGDPHQALYDAGYEMVLPARGKRGELNWRPATFARKDVVGRYRELNQKAHAAASEGQTAFSRAVYGATVAGPKRLIMGSPVWHGKNVVGRAVTTLLNDPGLAGTALYNVLRARFLHPDEYYQMKMEHWMDGGVPANRFNVSHHLHWLEQEQSGQRNFLWQMRHPLGAMSHAHAEMAEGWFWKSVDDVGTMTYMANKHRLMQKPGMTESMAGMLAAEHANNVAGMVNPLYMSKLWRWGRQMMFFAPTWWTTFYRTVGMSVPGMTRLSHFLKDTKFQNLDPVKMHSLDLRHRKEMVRMHRSYFITMMASAMAVHDMMNVAFSGHHVWENALGHTWDLEMDHDWSPQSDLRTGETKHVRMNSMFYYAQMADTLNAMGLGHDWGFLHQMQGEGFKKADGLHKMGILASSLHTGLKNQGAGKLSTAVPIASALNPIGGTPTDTIDPYTLLRDGQVQQVNRGEELMSVLPGGRYAQRELDQLRRAQLRAKISGQGPPGGFGQDVFDTAQAGLRSASLQMIGLPSLYYAGDEPRNGYHFLSDRETAKYLQNRQDIMTQKQAISHQMMTGELSPDKWVTENEAHTMAYLELLKDTFGDQSTGHSLYDARRQLYTKYNLDDPMLSKGERSYRMQQFEHDWDAQLDASSPEARAMWWETHTSMWTDADYLYWLSSQTRNAIMSHIDGEGGNHIRDAMRRTDTGGIPLDPKVTDALRQQDPYLWTYHQVMQQLGKSSLLGSLTAAYHSPFANFSVFPDDQAAQMEELDQAGALRGGATLVRQSSMERLAQGARDVSGRSAPSAGRFAQSPQAQEGVGGLTSDAIQAILEQDDELPATSKKRLAPQLRQQLEEMLSRG